MDAHCGYALEMMSSRRGRRILEPREREGDENGQETAELAHGCEACKSFMQYTAHKIIYKGSMLRASTRCARRSSLKSVAELSVGMLAVLIIFHMTTVVNGVGVDDRLAPFPHTGAVVGDRGFICMTFDGGYNWQEEQLEDQPPTFGASAIDLYDVFVHGDSSAFAVGGDCNLNYLNNPCGIFRRAPGRATSGGGAALIKWRRMLLPKNQGQEALRKLLAVTFCNGTLGFVAGQGGAILRTLNAGLAWEVMYSGVDTDLISLQCIDNTTMLAAGDRGTIIITRDSGNTFILPAQIPSGYIGPLRLLMEGETFALALGNDAAYASPDGGRTWKAAAAFSGTSWPLATGYPLWGGAGEGVLNLSLSLPMQGVYLSSSREPFYTAAVLSADPATNPSESLIQVLGVPLRNAVLSNASSRIVWQRHRVEMFGHAVALQGVGNACRDCSSILVAGEALTQGNKHCNAKGPTCSKEADASSRCCGPLQGSNEAPDRFGASVLSTFLTALYLNRSSVKVPVGCKDYTTCVALRAVRFSRTLADATAYVPFRPPPTPPPIPPAATATLLFLVDTSSYSSFSIKVFMDSLIALLVDSDATKPLQSTEDELYGAILPIYASFISYSVVQTMDKVPKSSDLVERPGFRDVTLVVDFDKLQEYGIRNGSRGVGGVPDAKYDGVEFVKKAVALAKKAKLGGYGSEFCAIGVRNFKVDAGAWGEKQDVVIRCVDGGLSESNTVVLICVAVAYLLVAIVLAWLFSLPQERDSPKNVKVAYALWLVFGIVGAHRFYLKQPRSGLVYMFTLGLFGVGWLADVILIPNLEHGSRHPEADRLQETESFAPLSQAEAPHPIFVTRRQALETLVELNQPDQARRLLHSPDEGQEASNVPRLLDELVLYAPDRREEYISPVLYPHTFSIYSEESIRANLTSDLFDNTFREKKKEESCEVNVVV